MPCQRGAAYSESAQDHKYLRAPVLVLFSFFFISSSLSYSSCVIAPASSYSCVSPLRTESTIFTMFSLLPLPSAG